MRWKFQTKGKQKMKLKIYLDFLSQSDALLVVSGVEGIGDVNEKWI